VVEPLYESLQVFSDSVLVAEKEGRFGLIAFSGKPLTEFIFDQVGQLSLNRALVVINNLVGYIDKKGSVVIPPKFEVFPNFLKRGQFSGAYALVSLKGKMGVIDQSGKVIVPLTFSGLGDVSSMMSFSKGKQWGFIDLSGKQLVEPSFDFAESVKEGKTLVEKNGLQGMIDAKGKVLIPIEYVSINRLSRDWWVVSNGSRSGLWNDKEGFLFAPTYQQIRLIDAQHIVFMNPDSIEYLYLPEKRVIKVKVSE
jgi:DNA-binding transcriptional regulator/RsmH inhibitor MraZ